MARPCYVALALGAIVLLSLHVLVNASGHSPDPSDEAGAHMPSEGADEEGGGHYRSSADRAADRERKRCVEKESDRVRKHLADQLIVDKQNAAKATSRSNAGPGLFRLQAAYGPIHDRPRRVEAVRAPQQDIMDVDATRSEGEELRVERRRVQELTTEMAQLMQRLRDMALMTDARAQEYASLGARMSQLQIQRHELEYRQGQADDCIEMNRLDALESAAALDAAQHENTLAEESAARARIVVRNELLRVSVPIQRAIEVLPHNKVACSMCYSDRFRAFVTDIDQILPRISRADRDERIDEWRREDANNYEVHADFLTIRCTLGCYICISCSGRLLATSTRARATTILCPCCHCDGRVATTGDRSLSVMANNDLERSNLALHVAWVPRLNAAGALAAGGHAVVEDSGRPEVNAVWLLLATIMLGIGGLAACPSCGQEISLPENCAHITCVWCKAHFCGWCLTRARSNHKMDGHVFGTGCQEYRVNKHAAMCHVLLWALYFSNFEFGTPRFDTNNFRYLVTPTALGNNIFGAHGTEGGSAVLGPRPSASMQWKSHWALALPRLLLAFGVQEDWLSPSFRFPISHTDSPFSRMWGDGNSAWESGYARLPFRRPNYHRVPLPPWRRADVGGRVGEMVINDVLVTYGWSHDSLRVMSAGLLHFTRFCEMVEDWVLKYTVIFRIDNADLSISEERLQAVFAFARKLRHRYECNVPWQALMAMRTHQLREGYQYEDASVRVDGVLIAGMADQRAETAADASHEPFPASWRLDTSISVYTWRLVDYWDTAFRDEDGVGEFRFFRQPWEGFPFTSPGETSINDMAQAGVIYTQVRNEWDPSEHAIRRDWEFSMPFHRRYLQLWAVYVADPANVEGPMPPELKWEHGDTE